MDRQLAKTLGAAARRARQSLELTQEDAAERIGVSVEFYARIERGNAFPSVPNLARIVKALGVSADVLLGIRSLDSSAESAWHPTGPPPEDSIEIRRVLRLLRRASRRTIRLVTFLIKELEQAAHRRTRGPDPAGSADSADSAGSDDDEP